MPVLSDVDEFARLLGVHGGAGLTEDMGNVWISFPSWESAAQFHFAVDGEKTYCQRYHADLLVDLYQAETPQEVRAFLRQRVGY